MTDVSDTPLDMLRGARSHAFRALHGDADDGYREAFRTLNRLYAGRNQPQAMTTATSRNVATGVEQRSRRLRVPQREPSAAVAQVLLF
jgi:hypothetical protein